MSAPDEEKWASPFPLDLRELIFLRAITGAARFETRAGLARLGASSEIDVVIDNALVIADRAARKLRS